jgi:sulfite reductase (NADPH) flavoprotein alpha-component
MSLAAVKPVLIRLHRWIGLVFAPVFLLLLLSGAVLSFRPIISDLASASAQTATAIDIFAMAKNLHKSLLLGLGIVVDIASWAMLAIMVIGPFLAWPRLRDSLIGWHGMLGWFLLPAAILSPLTAVLLTLSSGAGHASRPSTARLVAIPRALAIAAPEVDLSRLVMAGSSGGMGPMQAAGEHGGMFAVTDRAATVSTRGPSVLKQIHEGTWAGAWSGALNLAVSLGLLGLTVTGFSSWFRLWRLDRRGLIAAEADILVAHASQTGTAARVATATAQLLKEGGERVALAPLGTVSPDHLGRFRLLLIVAATTGTGDVPDGAMRFVKALRPATMSGIRFAILGLGDRTYANFCGGAEKLRAAMLEADGSEVAPLARADGDPIPTWTDWLGSLSANLGLRWDQAAAPAAGRAVHLRLADRHRLDDPGQGKTEETWSIGLESDEDLSFRPGDLLRLAPAQGERERAYSIGSSSLVDPRRIELTVRVHRWVDAAGREDFGRVSGHLVRVAPTGSRLSARIDPHPGFNPPEDPSSPIIMIGTGSGIAPYPGFLSERRASGRPGPAWLFFGNRHRKGDFLWAERFDTALKDGSLTRLDTAFSRDADDAVHIQARLMDAAEEVLCWLRDKKAAIYICGRSEMARGARQALAAILATHGGHSLQAAHAEVDRWVAEERIHIDAFE